MDFTPRWLSTNNSINIFLSNEDPLEIVNGMKSREFQRTNSARLVELEKKLMLFEDLLFFDNPVKSREKDEDPPSSSTSPSKEAVRDLLLFFLPLPIFEMNQVYGV
jgi:hypothetical protein